MRRCPFVWIRICVPVALAFASPTAWAQDGETPPPESRPPDLTIFDAPLLYRQQQIVAGLIRSGRNEEALVGLNAMLQRQPGNVGLAYTAAVLHARLGDFDAAVANLVAALKGGRQVAQRASLDPDFANLAEDPRFDELIDAFILRGSARK